MFNEAKFLHDINNREYHTIIDITNNEFEYEQKHKLHLATYFVTKKINREIIENYRETTFTNHELRKEFNFARTVIINIIDKPDIKEDDEEYDIKISHFDYLMNNSVLKKQASDYYGIFGHLFLMDYNVERILKKLDAIK